MVLIQTCRRSWPNTQKAFFMTAMTRCVAHALITQSRLIRAFMRAEETGASSSGLHNAAHLFYSGSFMAKPGTVRTHEIEMSCTM